MTDSDSSSERNNDHEDTGAMSGVERNVEVGTLRAVEAYGSGVRTTLHHNATAYGFSVTITAAYGMISVAHRTNSGPVQTTLFAVGGALAFLLVGVVGSNLFQRTAPHESTNVVMLSGAIDVVSILGAVGLAAACAQIPGTGAWVATSFVATTAYLLIGGLDVLLAHWIARRTGTD